MNRKIIAVGVVLVAAGCGGTSGGLAANRPLYCVDVDNATNDMNTLATGLSAKSVTTADAADLFGKVSKDLDGAAILSKGAVQAAAQAGRDAAGRLRVALLQGGAVGADSTALKAQLAVVQKPCGDG